MQATAGKETACALVFSTNLQCNSTNPNLESFFLSAGEPFVSLLYFAQSHGDVSQPYSCAGASAPPCPGDRALHWFSWRHSSHDGASSAPCVRGRSDCGPNWQTQPFQRFQSSRYNPTWPNIYFLCFLQIHIPSRFLRNRPQHTQEHFLFITMRSFHDLVSRPSSPLQGLMPSQKPLRQSRRDRGVSTYKATYWIQVQTKRTRSGLSSLGASLYSKKPNRPKQTSKLKKQQQKPLSLPPW